MKNLLDTLKKYGWIVVIISSATGGWIMMKAKVDSHSEKLNRIESKLETLDRASIRQEEINKTIDRLERANNRRERSER